MFNRRRFTGFLATLSSWAGFPILSQAQNAAAAPGPGLLNHLVGADAQGGMRRMRLTQANNPHSWAAHQGEVVGQVNAPIQILGAGWESFVYARRTDGSNQLLYIDTKAWAQSPRALSQLPAFTVTNVSGIDLSAITSFAYFGYPGFSNQKFIYFTLANGDLYWALHAEQATTQPTGNVLHSLTAVKVGVNFTQVVGMLPRSIGMLHVVNRSGQVFLVNDVNAQERLNTLAVSSGSMMDRAQMQPIQTGWLTPEGQAYDYVAAGGAGKIYCQSGNRLFVRSVALSTNTLANSALQILAHTSWPLVAGQWVGYGSERTFYQRVQAYLNETSVVQGTDIELCISSYLPSAWVSISEVTFNNGFDPLVDAGDNAVNSWNLREIFQLRVGNLAVQDTPFDSFANGSNWKVSFRHRLPTTWRPGQYVIRVMDDRGGYCWAPLVIRPAVVNHRQKVAVLANQFTWCAYNRDVAGVSFYSAPYCQGLMSLRTPYSLDGSSPHNYNYVGRHLLGMESIFLAWLRREGYDYDVYTDEDLHLGRVDLSRYKAFFITAHPEYWTQNQFNRVAAYVDAGGKFINLGGNSVYYAVQYLKSSAAAGGQIRQPSWPQSGNKRTRFEDSANAPNYNLIGTIYDSNGYGTYSSFKVLNSGHWLFANTGLVANSNFGFYKGIPVASGHETDKVTPFLSKINVHGLQILARGNNPDSNALGAPTTGKGGAEIVIFNRGNNGGWCLSSGSITSVVPLRGNSDPAMVQMMKNIMARV